MTLKISYFKLIKENIARRSYLFALSAVGLFFLLPVDVLMNISREKLFSNDLSLWAVTYLSGKINGTKNPFMILFIILIACLTAVSGFSYLHSMVKINFYHSLPVSRPRWLNISYLGGVAIFVVPYIIFVLCVTLIGQIYHVMTPLLFHDCMVTLSSGILMFLLIYNTAILSMMLAGRTGTSVLIGFALFFYALIPEYLYSSLGSLFFKTWSNEGKNAVLQRLSNLSPCSVFWKLFTTSLEKISKETLVSLFLILLLTFVFSHLLYKKYPSESAESALAFKKSASVIKLMAAVPLALSVTVLVDSVFFVGEEHSDHFLWWIILSLLFAIIFSFVIEFIYDRDLKLMVLRGKISSLVSVLLVLAILFIFRYDLLGYDKFMPKEEDLSEMSVYTPNFNRYFSYQLPIEPEALKTENIKPIYTLAKAGVKAASQAESWDNLPTGQNVLVTICYQMKDERWAYRDYPIEDKALVETLSLLCQDKEYKKNLIPIFSLDAKHVQGIFIQDITLDNTLLVLTQEQQAKLVNTYQEDLLDANISELAYDPPIAQMTFTYRFPEETENDKEGKNQSILYEEPKIRNIEGLFIYKSYKRTINLLKEYGYEIRTRLKAEDVEAVRVTMAGPKEQNGESPMDLPPITDPEEIQSYLDRIDLLDLTNGLTGTLRKSDRYLEVTFKSAGGINTYHLK